MSEDIFKEWKKNKFVVVGQDLLGESPERLIIITDISYWIEHEKELDSWCKQNNAVAKGMTVVFPDEKTLIAFCLRWS